MKTPRLLDESGQGQLLAAAIIGTVILTGSLFMFDWARHGRDQDVFAQRRIEMRSATELALKQVIPIYQNAGCDPVSFNDKMNLLQPTGTVAATGSPVGNRSLTITVNGHLYVVSISAPARLKWTGVDPTVTAGPVINRGQPQDAIVTAWTTYNSTATAPQIAAIQHQMVSQTAVLLNTCTNPCSATNNVDCPAAADRAIAYHRITPTAFPGGPRPLISSTKCFDPLGGARSIGDLNANATMAVADNSIAVTDLLLLKNYVRSGDATGMTKGAGVSAVSVAGSGFVPCADLNGDGMVNEEDVHILEKFLRGYLYWIPTHPLPPAP